MPLTDANCRNAKAGEKPFKLTDGGGLYLFVQTADPGGPFDLMRWMPPPGGILYAKMVSSKPNGGHINDDTNQHAGDRLGER